MSETTLTSEDSLRALIEQVVNGQATDFQRQQLEQRLLRDEQAMDAYLNYVNLHASLNHWFLAEPTEDAAMALAEFSAALSREQLVRSTKSGSNWGWLAACTAIGLLLVVVALQFPMMQSWFESAVPQGPSIIHIDGEVQLVSTDEQSAALTRGRALQTGETITTQSDDDRVILRYDDGTEIVLLGSSKLAIEQSLQGGKQLQLLAGLLQADVAPQPTAAPLVIVTPQTRVRVLGTRFELVTDEQDGTRLDLESGRVELVRDDQETVRVEPSSIALVTDKKEPIRVFPRPHVVDSPQRETVFRGLKSAAFAEDGTTLIGATRWQALYWSADDRLEIIPLSAHGRQGISLRDQSNSLLTYFDSHDRSLVVWDAHTRRPVQSFSNIAQLRRKFPSSKDRPENWNPTSTVAAISPEADCLVFQAAREFRPWRSDRPHWPEFAGEYDGQFVSDLAISPDGKTLAVAVRRGKLDLVDIVSGEINTSWSLRHRVPFAMDFSADGRRLVVGLAGRVRVYDVEAGEMLAEIEQPGLPFLNVAISADGRTIAAAALGEHVWVWDIDGDAEYPLLDVGGARDLAFSSDGQQLAVVSRGSRLTVWNLSSIAESALASESVTTTTSTR